MLIEKTKRSKKYLAYIRELPCVICGNIAVPHHTYGGATALKGSDYFTIPLCVKHHTHGNIAIHKLGRKPFEAHHNVDLKKIIMELLETYIDKETKTCECKCIGV